MALQSRSVAAEIKSLKKIFPEFVIDKLHSKMSPKDKEDVMERFEKGQVHILVATSVVEVGVNVPNATIILIEGAERFGLAQLHQLRGRVMRSTHQPYCFLMIDKASSTNNERLKAIVSAKNGFELAERDLQIRGAGELYGRRQWGLSDIGMEALKNLKLVEAARTEAFALVQKDPELVHFPSLKTMALAKIREMHFE
jgi:ATP-dependent DNA helicase RecG